MSNMEAAAIMTCCGAAGLACLYWSAKLWLISMGWGDRLSASLMCALSLALVGFSLGAAYLYMGT